MSNYIGNQPSAGEFKKLDSIASSFNGSLTQFDLDYSTVNQSVGDATQLIVSLNGIIQEPGIAYTLGIGGGSIIFASAPASGDTCHIVLLGGVGGTTTPTDGSVTASKLDSSLKDYLEETFTANGSQTTYTLTRAAIGSNSLLLSVDGILQPSTAYSVAGTTLTISPALPNTTNVRVVHLGVQSGVYIPAADSITSNQLATLNGNLNFDDNAKAVFGEGSDLQIYHDAGGFNQIVALNDHPIQIKTATENMIKAIPNGGVEIYHNNSERFTTTSTGIGVTGTVTTNGVIGSTTNFDIRQNTSDGADNRRTRIGGGGDVINTRGAFVELHGNEHASTGKAIINAGNVTGGEISLRTGGSEKVVITKAGNVGIGTSNPVAQFAVGGAGRRIEIQGTDAVIRAFDRSASWSEMQFEGASYTFDTSGTERMRINSSGNVGIGTSSPNNLLHLKDEGYQLKLEDTSSGNTGEILVSDTSLYFFSDRSNAKANSDIRFSVDNSEKMRIDSSGNLLVGKTTTDQQTAGSVLYPSGQIYATAASTQPLVLTRKTNDGALALLYKDTNEVGRIGVIDGDNTFLQGATDHAGIAFGSSSVLPFRNGSYSSDTTDLGASNIRFKDLYLSSGVYLGGTGSANKLDDYEEGTWTPVLGGSSGTSGQSYATQSGTYTKIGNVVHLVAYVVVNSIGSVSGTYGRVFGLPFTVAGGNGNYAGGFFQYFNGLGQNVNSLTSYAETGQTFAYVTFRNGPGTAVSYLSPAGWGSAPQIMFSMTYRTNA